MIFFKNKWLIPGALAICGFMAVSSARADGDDCYSVASIRGTYTVVATYGANVALALGVRHFDGKGNLTGTFTLNEPTAGSTTGARTIITGTQVGTYTVNCDGTGVITRTLTASNGIVTQQTDDFLVTKAVVRHDLLLVTGLQDMQRTPSAIVAGGIFVFRSYARLPDPDHD